jgi:DnaB-like helicase C terminal domain
MPDAVAHGKTVLAAIIADGGSLTALDYAQRYLTPRPEDFFTDPVQRVLFELLGTYAYANGGIMSRAALDDLMRPYPAGTARKHGEAYSALEGSAPEEHEFRHAVSQLRELAAERATGTVLATGALIMRQETLLPDGRSLYGHAEARAYVLAEVSDITHATSGESPDGDVTGEGDDVMAAYERAKEARNSGKVTGAEFGLAELDKYTGGLHDGQMALLMADTTAGKSSFCINMAWFNAICRGRNVVIFTTEQLYAAVRVKLFARHSRHEKFGLPRGLNDLDIRLGRLSPSEERALAAIAADLKGGGYGVLHVVQMPENATVSAMSAGYERLRRKFRPDLVVADYLQLFSPDKAKRDAPLREDQSGVLKAAARWCGSCDGGRGVPFISPWQANNEGVNAMKSSGRFSLNHTSETKEAGRTPDMVLALANREEDESGGRNAQLEVQVLKARGGPRGRRFPITADYATSYFADSDLVPEEGFPEMVLWRTRLSARRSGTSRSTRRPSGRGCGPAPASAG